MSKTISVFFVFVFNSHILLGQSEHTTRLCLRVGRGSHLYGSDSARNFLCSRGLALTLSSFTMAWDELQSHSTSDRITYRHSPLVRPRSPDTGLVNTTECP